MATVDDFGIELETLTDDDPAPLEAKSINGSRINEQWTTLGNSTSDSVNSRNVQNDEMDPQANLFEGLPSPTFSPPRLCGIDVLVVEEIDFELSFPVGKLGDLDFPKAEEGHEEDIAKVIRKGFTKLGIKDSPGDALSALAKSGVSYGHLSWQTQVEAAVEGQGDEFWLQVADKTQQLGIGRMEAIFEVYTDLLEHEAGSLHSALLWVLRREFKEFCTEVFVTRLLERGANIFTAGRNGDTPLHLAALRGFCNIGRKLLEYGVLVSAKNSKGQTPLELAVTPPCMHNDFAVLMIKRMNPAEVRQLFRGFGHHASKLSLHDLLRKDVVATMQDTVMAVLDTMIEPIPSQHDTFVIHYSILDGDTKGRPPNDKQFNKANKSCLHKIAKSNNKEIVYHDVVRLLLRSKWKKFARFHFVLQFVTYISVMVCLTCALVLAAKKSDPRRYDQPIDIFRGICEAITLLAIGYNGVAELNQMRIHKLYYLRDYHNYLDAPAVVFTFLIIPFRATGLDFQWVLASLSYLCNGLRSIEYAAVFRSTGAYVQILGKIIVQDLVQFGAIFCVFLLSFSGSFYLALRGEVRPPPDGFSPPPDESNTTVLSDNSSNSTLEESQRLFTSLDLQPFETAEYYKVVFTGIRVMIEGERVVSQYFGPLGYKWLGVLLYVVFLFFVIVILLNLLIAQMTDTYSSVQKDAQRSLALNRAWIVARVEHNSLTAKDHRKRFYKSCEVLKSPQDVLEKWEVPPINEVNKRLEKMERTIKNQEKAIEDLRNTVLEKMTEQGVLLERLFVQLSDEKQRGQSSLGPPRRVRSSYFN